MPSSTGEAIALGEAQLIAGSGTRESPAQPAEGSACASERAGLEEGNV